MRLVQGLGWEYDGLVFVAVGQERGLWEWLVRSLTGVDGV